MSSSLLISSVCGEIDAKIFVQCYERNPVSVFCSSVSDTPSKSPPHAIIQDGNVIYNPERYGGEMLLDVTRHKGSTGVVTITWGITLEPHTPVSFAVSPMSGTLEFDEGEWNSSIHLGFPFVPDSDQKIEIFVKLLNVSDGAMLGNFTTVRVIFPPNVGNSEVSEPDEDEESNKTDVIVKIVLPSLSGAFFIIGITAAIISMCKHQERYVI